MSVASSEVHPARTLKGGPLVGDAPGTASVFFREGLTYGTLLRMSARQPKTRDEAMLLSTFTFLFRDAEERILDFSYGNLRVGNGPRRLGLLVLLDTGIAFLPRTESYTDAQEGTRAANWPDIGSVAVKKKMIGQEITVTSRSLGRLTSRVSSPTLGDAIQAAWRSAQLR